MGDKLLSVKQAAKYLNVHWQTVRNYIKEKKINAYRSGRVIRIKESDLELFLKNDKPIKQKLEIECRYLITNRAIVETKILTLGAKIIHHSHIVDHWFIPRSIKNQKQHDEWYDSGRGCGIRIREEDNGYTGKITTTLGTKKLTKDLNHNTIMEAEVGIESYDQAMMLLEMMNKFEYLTIDKDRVVYAYKNLKICIDTIKDYAVGVEIENDTTKDRYKALKEISDLARSLGIDSSKALETSMTRLAMKKLAKF